MKVLLDEYVLPTSAVIEYRSNISGITEEHLASATKLPADIHDFILSNIARDDVLVGHTLNSDLKVGMPSGVIRVRIRYEWANATHFRSKAFQLSSHISSAMFSHLI
jgi:DNA polymerase III alpha subunit (gram-positive type)